MQFSTRTRYTVFIRQPKKNFTPCHPVFRILNSTATCIDRFTRYSGRIVAWLTLAVMGLTCAVVVMRYYLQTGSIALQESGNYLHASVFMLAIAYTLQRGGHVRVDIFYRNLSRTGQAWIDILGGLLFLLPLCVVMLWLNWDYVLNSWAVKETSSESGGLPWVYLLKTLMLIMPVTLLLQGVAETINNILLIVTSPTADDSATDSRD